MKAKNIFFVGILFVCLLAYIVSFEIPKSEYRETEKKPFHNIGKAQISSLEVKRTDGTFKLVNSQPKSAPDKSKLDENKARLMDAVAPNEWSIEGFAFNKVDSAGLNGVITQLVAFELGEALPATDLEKDLSLYGLSSPEVVLTSERMDQYGGRKSVKFEFGKKSDFLGKRYVRYIRLDGTSDIFLTDDLLFFALNKPVADFRRKDPIEFNDADITKIELSGWEQTEKLLFEKKPSKVPGITGERWNLVAPLTASADQSKIADALRNLKNLKAKDILEAEKAKDKASLLEHANLVVSLSTKSDSAKPTLVKVASVKEEDKEKTYFSVSGINAVFEANSNTTTSVLANANAYRQTKFFDIEVDDVQSFDLSGTYVLGLKGEKKDQNWMIADKAGDEQFIRQWLLDLKELAAQGFPTENKDFGFSAPSYRLTLKIANVFGGKDEKSIDRLLVVGAVEKMEEGKPKSYYAAVDDLSEPFVISKGALDKIIPKAEALLVVPTAVPTSITTPPPATVKSE